MKRKYFLILIIALLFFVCGCTKINNISTDNLVDEIINQEDNKTNEALNGYKFYMPVGMTLLNDSNSNNIIYSDGQKYYLYVDLLSYHNKKTIDYNSLNNKNALYYKEISKNDKKGYIIVTKQDEQYFLEVVYNYAKIEVLANNYDQSLVKALTILNSIEYNDKIVSSMIGNNILDYSEEEFVLKQPENGTASNDSLQYDGDYVDTENELPDEDIIKVQTE